VNTHLHVALAGSLVVQVLGLELLDGHIGELVDGKLGVGISSVARSDTGQGVLEVGESARREQHARSESTW